MCSVVGMKSYFPLCLLLNLPYNELNHDVSHHPLMHKNEPAHVIGSFILPPSNFAASKYELLKGELILMIAVSIFVLIICSLTFI